MSDNSIYATPRLVTDINECGFYHTTDVPGYGVVKGLVDLRDVVQEYLGKVDFNGKRVLEMGTASGFLCFYMESKGAEVVAYDLSPEQLWDLVPFYNIDKGKITAERKEAARKLNNAFWFCHRAFNSKAKMVYGTVYTVPREIGMVDISTFGYILQHVRDPFLALQNSLRLTRETVIITGFQDQGPSTRLLAHLPRVQHHILDRLHIYGQSRVPPRGPQMRFVPTSSAPEYADTWWTFSPECLRRMIAVLGFEEVSVALKGSLYTLVGHRTQDYYQY